jgi:pentatricopeptide repeat protein
MAVNACSQKGDLDSALGVYNDMMRNGVRPDEVFYSALIDAAGHSGKIDVAFEIFHGAKLQGLTPGSVLYSSLMGACCNTKCWQKALEVYEEIKVARFIPTVSTLNALITSLCDADKLHSSAEVLEEMKQRGVVPNCITYTMLLIACQRKDEPELAVKLFSRATMDGVVPNLTMCNCVIGLCLRRFRKASALGESIVSYDSGNAQIHNQWTSRALLVYRQTISAGLTPTVGSLSQVLGCLRMPTNATKENGFNESLGFNPSSPKQPKLYSLLEGFRIYDPRAFSLYEEAASLGVVPCFLYKDTSVSIDARQMEVYVVEVYLLTILKGLKYRLAAGALLPNITVRLPVEKMPVNSVKGQKLVNVSGRTGQAVAALLRRLNLPYQGNETYGKIRISGRVIRHWLSPKSYPPSSKFPGRTLDSSCPNSHLGKGIVDQQRMIRTEDLSIDESTGSLIAKNLDHKSLINRPWEDRSKQNF